MEPNLILYTFDQFNGIQVAAMQAVAGVPLDFDPGSIFLAFVQSNSGVALSLQSQATYDLSISRLQTSTGTNVDSFIQQFQLTRRGPTYAYGVVTFIRSTATQAALIAAGIFNQADPTQNTQGALVYSPVSTLLYSVYADVNNINYSPADQAYIMPIGVYSIAVPIYCTTPGAIGNVLANQINTIYSQINFVSNVTNQDPIDTGTDQETDSQVKIRFPLYLQGLSKGNYDALSAAILAVAGVNRYKLHDLEDIDGNPSLATFYTIVDDGNGNASPTLLANVYQSVYNTRALGIMPAVYGPTAFPINITAHVFTDGSVDDSVVQSAVVTSLTNMIEGFSFDATLPYSYIPTVIYETNSTLSTNPKSPIINVTNYTLNGGTSDISVSGRNIMTVGTLTVIMNA